jgi:hypothetical protein
MKIMVITFYLWGLFIPFAFSQHGEHVGGGNFLKRVEFNNWHGSYNLNSKGYVEKLFFGDFNAQVEFFYAPSFVASKKGTSGFRIVGDSRDSSYIIEFKHIPNYEKVFREKQNEEMIKFFEVRTLSFPISDQRSVCGKIVQKDEFAHQQF